VIGRYRHLISPKLRARTLPTQQQVEATIAVTALNRMTRLAKPLSWRCT
jgi:hypothetical protein